MNQNLLVLLAALAPAWIHHPKDAAGVPGEHYAPVPLQAAREQGPPGSPPAAPAPGAVPADTAPQARSAWEGLVAAVTGGKASAPIVGFELWFDGRVHSGARQSNDFDDARYRFLEPGFVGMRLKSGRERMRGPEGDWLIEKGTPVRLQGRDFQEDVRELGDTLRIARTFAGLSDPRSLRLEALELLGAPPSGLPEALAGDGARLTWLSVVSPDFHRTSTPAGAEPPLTRVDIGLDPTSHLPALALVRDARSKRSLPPGAILVRLEDYRPLDGFLVPWNLRSFPLDDSLRPPAFAPRPAMELWLKGGTLRPDLAPAHFAPAR